MPAYAAAGAVLTADTLWDLAQHTAVLGRTPTARAHLVVGLHTTWYTLYAFFLAVRVAGLVVLEREMLAGSRVLVSSRLLGARTSASGDDDGSSGVC
jgi:hypothetical protein